MRPLIIVVLLVLSVTLVSAQPTSDLIYVPSPETQSVLVIDPDEATVTEAIGLDAEPVAIVVHPDSGLVYVVTTDENALVVIDETSVTETVELDNAPVGLSLDEEANSLTIMFEDTDDTLILDADSLEPVSMSDVGEGDEDETPFPFQRFRLLLPSYPLCPLSSDADRETFQTNLTPNLIDLQCRVLAEDGKFIQSPAEIGIQDIIDLGVIHAVEVFSPSGANVERVDICLLGSGNVFFLDADDQPRTPNFLQSVSRAGYSCVQLPGPGTLILVS